MHLAEIIADFIDDDILPLDVLRTGAEEPEASDEHKSEPEEESSDLPPISEAELNKFVNIDLDKLDNVDYFKRHLE